MATLNLQVGASGDDGESSTAPAYSSSGASVNVGRTSPLFDAWHRFTGVSGLSGATITAADWQLYEKDSEVGTRTNVYADDSEAPAAPTDRADHVAKTRTTAFVALDDDPGAPGFHGLEIKTVIQELADSHDPSAIQILHDNNASPFLDNNEADSWDADSAKASKLDITYTPVAGATRGQMLTTLGVS